MTPEMEKRYRAFCEKHQLYYDDGNRNIGWSELSAAFAEGASYAREEDATIASRFVGGTPAQTRVLLAAVIRERAKTEEVASRQ